MVKTQQLKRIIIVKRDKRDCKIDTLKEKKGIDREEGAFLKDINPQECVNTKSKNNKKKLSFMNIILLVLFLFSKNKHIRDFSF